MTPEEFKSKLVKQGTHRVYPGQNVKYPNVRIGGRQELVHRAAYRLEYGEIPEGFTICVTCELACCCNPNHLVMVPSHDRKKINSLVGKIATGENTGLAKLTTEKAQEIKQLLQDTSQLEIAEAYEVSPMTIYRINIGKSWKKVEVTP